jgi:hypothetical protein
MALVGGEGRGQGKIGQDHEAVSLINRESAYGAGERSAMQSVKNGTDFTGSLSGLDREQRWSCPHAS